jgi:hypothetical protein
MSVFYSTIKAQDALASDGWNPKRQQLIVRHKEGHLRAGLEHSQTDHAPSL